MDRLFDFIIGVIFVGIAYIILKAVIGLLKIQGDIASLIIIVFWALVLIGVIQIIRGKPLLPPRA